MPLLKILFFLFSSFHCTSNMQLVTVFDQYSYDGPEASKATHIKQEKEQSVIADPRHELVCVVFVYWCVT